MSKITSYANPRNSPQTFEGQRTLNYTSLSSDPDESHMLALNLLAGAQRILEVGAATGYVTEAMQQGGATVVAVEIDPDAVEAARARGIEIRLGSVQDVVAPAERFDHVVLLDVIEHVPHPDALFEACLSHLAPGGSIVLSVPNVAHWSIRWLLLRGRFDYTRTGLLDETHVRLYTAASLERLLARHGLTIAARRHSLGLFNHRRISSPEWRWQLRKTLRWLADARPGLFAYQFVWKATRNPVQ
jgi:2-polyprenyl-3-methyl-5-hydroxy-6-metoxy-1,4-benzoquinol methylase